MRKKIQVERMPDSEPLLYSREHAAMRLSVSKRTIDYLLARNELEWKKIGRRKLITAASLRAFARCNHYGPVKGPESDKKEQDKAA